MQKQMNYYSNDPAADKISKVKGEIDEVKSVMVTNIEQVLARGEKIELLVDKTENLNQQAFKFKRQSRDLKNSMWWKNVKLMIIIFVIVVLVLYFIIAMACGTPDLSKC
jgi:vesicle-associated membrane protein 7